MSPGFKKKKIIKKGGGLAMFSRLNIRSQTHSEPRLV